MNILILQSGDRLLTGCNDKCIRIFSLADKVSEPEMIIEAHKSAIKCAIWSKDSNHVVTCAEDNELRYIIVNRHSYSSWN